MSSVSCYRLAVDESIRHKTSRPCSCEPLADSQPYRHLVGLVSHSDTEPPVQSQTVRVDRIGAEQPPPVELQHDRFWNVDWGEECGEQLNLANAARAQQHRYVTHDDAPRY